MIVPRAHGVILEKLFRLERRRRINRPQQASTLVKSMQRLLEKKSLPIFTYRDYGSLISLGHYEAVGNLMGRMVGRSVKIQGFLARMLYLSLYRNHQMALHGFFRMAVDAFVDWLRHNTKPRVKLH